MLAFPHSGMMLFEMHFVLVQEGKLACTSFPHGGMMLL
jgi:hypothetical protein